MKPSSDHRDGTPGSAVCDGGTPAIIFCALPLVSRGEALTVVTEYDDLAPPDRLKVLREMALKSDLLFTIRAREQMAERGVAIDDIDQLCSSHPRTPIAAVHGDPIVIVVSSISPHVTRQCPTCLEIGVVRRWRGHLVHRGVELAARGLRCARCDEQLIDAAEMRRHEQALVRQSKRAETSAA